MGYAQEKKGQQKVSTLKHSHRKPAGWLASWGLLTIFCFLLGFSLYLFSAWCLKTSAVWCEHPGGSALFLGNAPRERKRHREGDLALRNGNARPAVQRHAGGCSNWSRVSI